MEFHPSECITVTIIINIKIKIDNHVSERYYLKVMNKIIKTGCCGFPVNKVEYFSKFRLIEIQNTFYQPPGIETLKKWRQIAPVTFEFSLKAWQLITHPPASPTYRKLKEPIPEKIKPNFGFFKITGEVFSAWETTRKAALALKASCIVFQCPASFKPMAENIKNLTVFFKKIKRDNFVFIWEPRGNWPEEKIKSLCRELNLIHAVNPFKAKSQYGKINYFRLHGNTGYRYQYKKEELLFLKKLCQKDINYVLFNNTSRWKDAQSFKNLI